MLYIDEIAFLPLSSRPVNRENRRRLTEPRFNVPPDNAKPLSTIVQTVEGKNLGTVTEIEFDNGVWEINIFKDGLRTGIIIDPATGQPLIETTGRS